MYNVDSCLTIRMSSRDIAEYFRRKPVNWNLMNLIPIPYHNVLRILAAKILSGITHNLCHTAIYLWTVVVKIVLVR